MYSVELYSRVHRACHVEGMSERSAARPLYRATGAPGGGSNATTFLTGKQMSTQPNRRKE